MALIQKIKDMISEKIPLEIYDDNKLDIEKVFAIFNLNFYYAEFENDGISGAIKRESESNWKIFINDTDSRRRKRFTAAHEIGHYISYLCESHSKKLIDEKGGLLRDSAIIRTPDENRKHAEAEANEIAAQILMRQSLVEKLVTENKNIEEMANYFDVSETAMTFRLVNLGYKLLEAPVWNVAE